jgi:hypothetical protein
MKANTLNQNWSNSFLHIKMEVLFKYILKLLKTFFINMINLIKSIYFYHLRNMCKLTDNEEKTNK